MFPPVSYFKKLFFIFNFVIIVKSFASESCEMLKIGQPRFLQSHSLSHSVKRLVPDGLYPYKPENYVLLSEKNVITDWHVDCTGSEVFYEVLSGAKEITFVEPTARNKELSSKFLPNEK